MLLIKSYIPHSVPLMCPHAYSTRHKKFSEQKQAHLGMDLSEPAKQDRNDNTILLYHPYMLCHFANYALCLCSSEGTRCMGVVKVLLGHFYLGF